MKNEKSGAESFAENMREKLGLDKPLPKEVMDDLREGVIDLGKKTGDTDAEDVLDNCLIELNRLKDNQSKAIVITYLLGTLPMDLQKFIADQQQKIVVALTAKNLEVQKPCWVCFLWELCLGIKIQMNNEIKVSLSVTLQGSVMLSQEQAKALEKEKVGTGYDTFNMRVEGLKDGKKDAETITVKTRKCKPAGQSLNLSMDAYDYMTGKEAPYFVKAKDWEKLTKKQRLEAHLKRICEELGGVSFTYAVLDN